MYFTNDPLRDFERYEAEQEEALKKLPLCEICEERIQDEYGICIECGCEISPARLEAKPYARFCTKCKAMYEEMEDPSRRHR